jgi:hypothetical protein
MTHREKILQEEAKKDIESQVGLSSENCEAYYSPRYGWTLRKKITEDKEELQAV